MVQPETSPEALASVFEGLIKQKQGSIVLNEEADYEAALKQAAVMILELRALLREKCEETESLREKTAVARTTLDESSLKLKNLAYEKDHYSKETQTCLSFRSAYDDASLELVPVSEFLHMCGDNNEDAHALMKSRLTHEMNYRKETIQELEAVRSRRDALAADVAQRRGTLSALEGEIRGLQAKGQVVAERLGLAGVQDVGSMSRQLASASHLPTPLYVAFSQLRAAAAARNGDQRIEVTAEQSGVGETPYVSVRIAEGNHPEEASVRFGFDLVWEESRKLVSVRPHEPHTTLEQLALLRPADCGLANDGDAFAWAQHLAGLDVLPALLSTERAELMRETMERYRSENRAGALLDSLLDLCSAAMEE